VLHIDAPVWNARPRYRRGQCLQVWEALSFSWEDATFPIINNVLRRIPASPLYGVLENARLVLTSKCTDLANSCVELLG
jgi:hypothetical protein